MNKENKILFSKKYPWLIFIILQIIIISILHYTTPTMKWQYHLIFMQAYFIPILFAAFQFGIRGGVFSALAVTVLYLPHVMLQWGGFTEENLMRFLQIILFNVIGYITGLKSQREQEEKKSLQNLTIELDKKYLELKLQSDKIAELEEQLRHADRLAIIGELSASLAHEVRNPLGAIRGAVEIIRDETPDNSKQNEFANILIEETKRLDNVVENYLSYARKQKKTQAVFQLNEIIQNSVLLLANQARKKDIKIHTHISDLSLFIKTDANDLRQVLINLILNAIESIGAQGEVTITARQELLDSNKKEIQIEVTDTGLGIKPDMIEKVFQPFYTTKKNGSGLGLAIVKRVCESNGWKISVNSKDDMGSTFKLVITTAK